MENFEKILLIICDQFRFPRHWDSLGPEDFPNLQRLRDKGLEFNNAYIASAACNASRACIYSGKYSKETGVTSTSGFGNEATTIPEKIKQKLVEEKTHVDVSWFGIHPEDPRCSLPHDTVIKTLGTHFRTAGFRAIYKGKWHLSEVERGWPDKPYDAEGLDKYGFEGWNPPEGHGSTALRYGMGADASYAQDVAQSLYEMKDTNYKWFMAANLINPHDVGFYDAWPLKIPNMGITLPPNFDDDLNSKPRAQKVGQWYWNKSTFPEGVETEDWEEYVNFYPYLAQIADFNVGIILDALEASGQADDTMVIFLSDHGEMGGSHQMTQKWYQAYEETIHVPLIFSNPKVFRTGQQTDSMASLIDIAPTILSLAGIELPKPGSPDRLRGHDLSEILKDPNTKVQDDILYVTNDDIVGTVFEKFKEPKLPNATKWQGERPFERKFRLEIQEELMAMNALQAPRFLRTIVTSEGWKLTRYTMDENNVTHLEEDVYEMYNLNADPPEMNNLMAPHFSKEYNAKFEELKERLDQLLLRKYDHKSMRECEGETAE